MRRVIQSCLLSLAIILSGAGCGNGEVDDSDAGDGYEDDGGGGGDDAGTGGDDAGSGGDDAGTGGDDAGAGGDDAGAGGDDAGVGGDDGGVGGDDGGGGSDVGPSNCPHSGYIIPVPGENVGRPNSVSLTELPANAGDFHDITADDAVIDGKLINACVRIKADNVIIRNSHIRCTIQNMGGSPYVGAVSVESGSQNALIEYNDLECWGADENRENCRFGIKGRNLRARFNNVWGGTDGFCVYDNSFYECNYVHHLPRRPVDYQSDGYSHNDGVQGFSGYSEIRGNWFEGNTMDNGQGIFYQTESFSNLAVDAVIENNYLTGFWKNIIQCNLKGGMKAVECRVDNNVIRDDEVNLQSNGSRWITIAIQNGATGSAACNRWGDGTFIPDNLVVGVTHQTDNCP